MLERDFIDSMFEIEEDEHVDPLFKAIGVVGKDIHKGAKKVIEERGLVFNGEESFARANLIRLKAEREKQKLIDAKGDIMDIKRVDTRLQAAKIVMGAQRLKTRE